MQGTVLSPSSQFYNHIVLTFAGIRQQAQGLIAQVSKARKVWKGRTLSDQNPNPSRSS